METNLSTMLKLHLLVVDPMENTYRTKCLSVMDKLDTVISIILPNRILWPSLQSIIKLIKPLWYHNRPQMSNNLSTLLFNPVPIKLPWKNQSLPKISLRSTNLPHQLLPTKHLKSTKFQKQLHLLNPTSYLVNLLILSSQLLPMNLLPLKISSTSLKLILGFLLLLIKILRFFHQTFPHQKLTLSILNSLQI